MVLFTVEEGAPVQHDAAPVGSDDAGNALERHGFAAARGAQKPQRPALRRKGDLEGEGAKVLFQIHQKGHQATSPKGAAVRFRAVRSSRSNRLTVSRTAAEMAMFTSTQR